MIKNKSFEEVSVSFFSSYNLLTMVPATLQIYSVLESETNVGLLIGLGLVLEFVESFESSSIFKSF